MKKGKIWRVKEYLASAAAAPARNIRHPLLRLRRSSSPPVSRWYPRGAKNTALKDIGGARPRGGLDRDWIDVSDVMSGVHASALSGVHRARLHRSAPADVVESGWRCFKSRYDTTQLEEGAARWTWHQWTTLRAAGVEVWRFGGSVSGYKYESHLTPCLNTRAEGEERLDRARGKVCAREKLVREKITYLPLEEVPLKSILRKEVCHVFGMLPACFWLSVAQMRHLLNFPQTMPMQLRSIIVQWHVQFGALTILDLEVSEGPALTKWITRLQRKQFQVEFNKRFICSMNWLGLIELYVVSPVYRRIPESSFFEGRILS
ncbi:hypothetical protein R3P38DRAFT_3365735 [Favolaschia claudopus]|uniref:Uncharacterized protein n=1 Tax=Favolaschia claudopus TaxID=2862362 RepID=A0AAW0AG51_9AGAR